MELQFDYYNTQNGLLTLCPNCHSNNLCHAGVEIFERTEDAKEGLHVSVSNMEVHIDSNIKANPSSRRHGVVIHCWCENCSVKHVRNIIQHKGSTYIDIIKE